MPKPGFTLGILVSLLSLCLEVSIEAQTRETKPETSTISGLVTLKGEPARGVTVLLQEQRTHATNAPRARTDENGRFRFTGVASGKYSIYALAPGYISPGDSSIWERRALNVAEGEKIENISLELRRGGVIAGRVTDSRGRPAIEETVTLSRLNKDGMPQNSWFNNQNYEMYRTDDRGAYRIFGVPEGRYLVSVGREQRPGSIGILSDRVFYPRAYHHGVASESKAKVIEVSEGSEATDVDIDLPEPEQTCEISGRVVDADTGQPVASVKVGVGSLSDGRPSGGWVGDGASSSTNGEFRLSGVLPGKYSLFANSDHSYAPTGRPGANDGAGFISEPVILNVEGDVQGVEIKVTRGASISGVVVIEGTNDPKILSKLSQASLYVSIHTGRQTFTGSGSTRVNSDGKFHFRGLQAGKASLSLSRSPNMEGIVLARIEHNGAATPDGIGIEAGQQVTGVRVVLAHGAFKVRGELKVVGVAEPESLRFRVIATRVDMPLQYGTSVDVDARGRFVLENILPGEYEFRVSPGFAVDFTSLDPRISRLIFSFRAKVVVVGADQQPVVLVLDLSRKEGN
ncbi:MAG TPA: carboxypeptidase regulatory-like domain-containing protein [Blastocatellia bacterium]|nr:carboxypeptidase regulatory-like domain-containing protein [Blastocatellia bacterium]